MLVFFIVINIYFNLKSGSGSGPYYTINEFLKTIDIAPIIDSNPGKNLLLSFDVKARKKGDVTVYLQNGVSSKYSFTETVKADVDYCHYELEVTPVLNNTDESEAYLSFYGGYGTNVIPTVKSINVTVLP